MSNEQNRKQFASKTIEQQIAWLMEECGEVVAAGGKSLRFGINSSNPFLPEEEREANIDWLKREVEDLKYAISMFEQFCEKELENDY